MYGFEGPVDYDRRPPLPGLDDPYSRSRPRRRSPRRPRDFPPVGPRDFSPRGPRDFSPGGPRDFSSRGPRDFSPRGPRNFSPRGPRDFSPRGPRDLSPRRPRDFSPRGPREVSPRGLRNGSPARPFDYDYVSPYHGSPPAFRRGPPRPMTMPPNYIDMLPSGVPNVIPITDRAPVHDVYPRDVRPGNGLRYPMPGERFPWREDEQVNKNYTQAVKRNFNVWAEWRAAVNDNLVDDVLYPPRRSWADVPTFEQAVHTPNAHDYGQAIHMGDPTPLLKYSVGQDNATSLPNRPFLEYGIPRVKANKENPDIRHFKAENEFSKSKTTTRPREIGNEPIYARREEVLRARQDRYRDDRPVLRDSNVRPYRSPEPVYAESAKVIRRQQGLSPSRPLPVDRPASPRFNGHPPPPPPPPPPLPPTWSKSGV